MGTDNTADISYSRSYYNSSKTPLNTIISCLSYVSGYISGIKNTFSFHKPHLYLKNLKVLFKIKYSNLYIPFCGRLGLLGLGRSALKCRLQLLQTSVWFTLPYLQSRWNLNSLRLVGYWILLGNYSLIISESWY